jgi:undecaprenyl-diphosphatase
MSHLQALILGIIQGLTEFLPISSSGHLELMNVLFKSNPEGNLAFTVMVHGATVLSTLIIFFYEIWNLLKGLTAFRWNEETQYVAKLIISMIPVAIAGLLFEDFIESFFGGNIVFVGSMLLITAGLLALTHYAKNKQKEIGYKDAFIIGIAQAFAVLPGISRSGATISTGLMLGNKKNKITQFSFLMVLIPVIGANIKVLMEQNIASDTNILSSKNILGFLGAFIAGLIACKWMIGLVKRGKIIYFSIYCLIIGVAAIIFGIT